MRRRIAPLALTVLLALSACGSSGSHSEAKAPSKPKASNIVVAGHLLLRGQYYTPDGVRCDIREGYEDIHAGTVVTVYDANGTKIALGALGVGQAGPKSRENCTFSFIVPDVPASGNIFSLEVANRGQVNFTKDEAASISLTLGDNIE